jgi:uncharacterized RDD family membrane protein YckC
MTERNRYALPQAEVRDDWTAAISGELSYRTISLGGFASFTAMHGYLLATRAQTIGKWLVGTRIVRADNDEVPTLARTVSLRYGTLAIGPVATLSVLVLNWSVIPYVLIVVGLIDIALVFRRDRRCLHDLIARTKVVAVARPSVTSALCEIASRPL